MKELSEFWKGGPIPGGAVCLSNGLIGIGLCPISGEDDSSGWQSLMIAGQYSDQGPRSLLRFTNPVGIACLVGENKVSSLDPPPSARFRIDYSTGVYDAYWKRDGIEFYWRLVLDPVLPLAVERLTVSGPPGQRVEVSAGPPETFRATDADLRGDLPSSVTYTTKDSRPASFGDKIGPRGTFSIERMHAFGGIKQQMQFFEIANRAKDWASGPDAPSIELDGPLDDQQFLNSALFHLRSGVAQSGPTGPFGLTNPRYGGRAFWDADTWVFPALSLLDPDRAASIPRFRLQTRDAARTAAHQWAANANKPFDPAHSPYKFPWEAGPDGREESSTLARNQEHVTGDVSFAMETASALGLIDPEDAQDTVRGCAQYLLHRATRLADQTWGVLRTMSPDEFTKCDNDLYTNALTERCLRKAFPDRWNDESFKRPHDSKTFLTYDGDPLRGYKQAAALLALWPLQDPVCEKEAGLMVRRFAGMTTPNGPAMSHSVEALVGARYGDPDEAYLTWRGGWKKYTTRPLMMFSEAPDGRQAYFLTGAAGCLDAVLYGFVGLRIDDHDPGTKPWKTPLKGGWWLSCEPHLPKAWKRAKIRNLRVLGKRFELSVAGNAVTVTEQRPS